MPDDTDTPNPPETPGGSGPSALSGTPLYSANEKITKINVADEIKNSFLDYSMSVIISRALPDVRDGLKPSQRRILFAMGELNLNPGRKTLKCAKIVGETMGNYHPHGDQAIYPTLVHMAQPWAMRERLVEGKGNFGSVEDDPPASMRYTEARLTHLGAALMQDMEKDTVDFVPNYDDTRAEPTVFPAAFPNLLVNGGTGIAVGMATNMAPHNLGEVIDGIIAQIDNPAIAIPELMKFVKGPDFPTGGMVCGVEGIKNYFHTGRGSVKLRGKVGIEQMRGGREQLVITEIPFNVNRAALEQQIAGLVNEKVITDVSAMRNESDENCRLVIELKRDAIAKVVINNLYEHTQMEVSFSVNALSIDHGKPKTLNLKELIAAYIDHRREVVLRRTRFELKKAEERAELLEGYICALKNLDEFIRIIRGSRNREEAKVKLLAFEWNRPQVEQWGVLIRSEARLLNGFYALTERQVDAILELQLYRLTGLEFDKVRQEYTELLAKIKDLLDVLAREERVMKIIKDELKLIREKHATPRLTDIVPDEGEIAIEDLIANEGVIITITHAGLIKRTNVSSYRSQRRGGRGVIGMATREVEGEQDRDALIDAKMTSGHNEVVLITHGGMSIRFKEEDARPMGRPAVGVYGIDLETGDRVVAAAIVDPSATLLVAGENGIGKRTAFDEYRIQSRGGKGIITMRTGDKTGGVVGALTVRESDEIMLITNGGQMVRTAVAPISVIGRNTQGVKLVNLAGNDKLQAIAPVVGEAAEEAAGDGGAAPAPPA